MQCVMSKLFDKFTNRRLGQLPETQEHVHISLAIFLSL